MMATVSAVWMYNDWPGPPNSLLHALSGVLYRVLLTTHCLITRACNMKSLTVTGCIYLFALQMSVCLVQAKVHWLKFMVMSFASRRAPIITMVLIMAEHAFPSFPSLLRHHHWRPARSIISLDCITIMCLLITHLSRSEATSLGTASSSDSHLPEYSSQSEIRLTHFTPSLMWGELSFLAHLYDYKRDKRSVTKGTDGVPYWIFVSMYGFLTIYSLLCVLLLAMMMMWS